MPERIVICSSKFYRCILPCVSRIRPHMKLCRENSAIKHAATNVGSRGTSPVCRYYVSTGHRKSSAATISIPAMMLKNGRGR